MQIFFRICKFIALLWSLYIKAGYPSRGVASFARSGGAKVFGDFRRLFLAEILTFLSGQKQVISKKKRFSPKSEGFFWPKSQIFRPKPGDLQKIQKNKTKGLRRNPKAFSDVNHKFQRFFRPKKKTTSSSQKNTVGVQEINLGGKNENRGSIAPVPPRWRRACILRFLFSAAMLFLEVTCFVMSFYPTRATLISILPELHSARRVARNSQWRGLIWGPGSEAPNAQKFCIFLQK